MYVIFPCNASIFINLEFLSCLLFDSVNINDSSNSPRCVGTLTCIISVMNAKPAAKGLKEIVYHESSSVLSVCKNEFEC